MKYNIKYKSILNYYTDWSSQLEIFLEIDIPKRVDAILGNGVEFKDKIMLHCFRGVKSQQGFTPGIWY